MPRKTDAKPQAASDPPAAGYTVLARRYRSRDFAELVGQEPIARTLQNAIATGRTAHAYLFCGTRGVGKTSMARIFAKALNVSSDLAQAEEIGKAILRGDDLDVIEIDGASNRGINEARDLIANAGISPARCRYKIYIIDEVHALTKDAFNALLKLMEEPPSHVKFILCTTEANKVPATIQSRCQRFDFRPLPTAKIAEQLRMILREEGIDAKDEIVIRIAQLGNGSMRDALSLLDRLLAAGEKELTAELLEQMLGLPDRALVASIVDAFIGDDPKLALERGERLLRTGATVEQAMELLAEHLRTLLVIASCGEDTDIVEMSAESKRAAAVQAAQFDAAGLVHLIAICDAVGRNSRQSAASRALFDAALVRMAMSERFADVTTLLREGGAASGHGDAKKKAVIDASPQPTLREPFPPKRAEGVEMPAPVTASAAETTIESKPSIVSDEELWDRVLQYASRSMGARAKLEDLVFESFDGRTVRLSLDERGASRARFLTSQVDQLIDLVRTATGRSVRIELDTGVNAAAASSDTNAAPEVRSIPVVQRAMELFDAVVIDVQDTTQLRPAGAARDRGV